MERDDLEAGVFDHVAVEFGLGGAADAGGPQGGVAGDGIAELALGYDSLAALGLPLFP